MLNEAAKAYYAQREAQFRTRAQNAASDSRRRTLALLADCQALQVSALLTRAGV